MKISKVLVCKILESRPQYRISYYEGIALKYYDTMGDYNHISM